MPSIKIGNFRLSVVNESKLHYKYTYNGKYQNPPPKLIARNEEIYKLYLKGWTQAAIAQKVGIGQARVSTILKTKYGIVSFGRRGRRGKKISGKGMSND